jgi:hypothetical protein
VYRRPPKAAEVSPICANRDVLLHYAMNVAFTSVILASPKFPE